MLRRLWRRRRAADTSTNLCRRTASMQQVADRTEAAAVDHYLSSPTETFLAQSAMDTQIQTDDCFVMRQ